MKKLLHSKKILLLIIVATILIVAILIMQMMNFMASLYLGAFGAYQQEQENNAALNLDLDKFTISGSFRNGKYYLTFDFGSWKIKDIELEAKNGEKYLTVKIPAMAGSRREIAYKYLRRNGFSHEAAVGVVVNIMVESAYTYSAIIEEGDNAKHQIAYRGENVIHKGYGICQWTNAKDNPYGRRYKVINFLKEKGLDVTQNTTELYLAELEYAIKEYPHITNKIKNSTSAYDAAAIWCREWEVPSGGEYSVRQRGQMAIDNAPSFANISVYASETETQDARLSINLKIEKDEIVIEGRLNSQEIAGSFKVNSNSVSGDGYYGTGAVDFMNAGKLWYQVVGSGTMSPPLPPGKYLVGHGFGYRGDIGVKGSSKYHRGVDIFADPDTPILAAADGIVYAAGYDVGWSGAGNMVEITHEGGRTLYCHMIRAPIVKEGQKVRAGQVIGYVGTTGASSGEHLHFSLYSNKEKDWVDPQQALGIKLHEGWNGVYYVVKEN